MSKKIRSARTLDGKLLHYKGYLGEYDDINFFQIFFREALPSMNILLAAKHKRKDRVLQYLLCKKQNGECGILIISTCL